MKLETMEPNSSWDPVAYEGAVATLGEEEYVFKVWGGDWCTDCQSQLPEFAAALEAAGVPDTNVEHYPVEKEDDGSKTGPGVEEYGVELIPTVVVESDGEEVARFVEEEDVPIAVYLAEQLE
ncbi:Thiol-disulfide isomerase or thioredoxin [Halogranum amylolyticum]|uniref:Thiol-disulfide isomerase or thioredoxin n=1 Tax=Halogranum amylolyticum TaxID=660520 RepID=A0A1H8T7U0_9EURY|nr:thioredoxin family protein [Halogranum amylolyticum]SEO87017.1 Thiol-disulfide isomerase or thioredoxin [Halogranum amylolyticum]